MDMIPPWLSWLAHELAQLVGLGQGVAVAAGPAEGAIALDDAPETGAAEYRAPGGLDLDALHGGCLRMRGHRCGSPGGRSPCGQSSLPVAPGCRCVPAGPGCPAR